MNRKSQIAAAAAVAGIFLVLVAAIMVLSVREWFLLLSRRGAPRARPATDLRMRAAFRPADLRAGDGGTI